jgi:hypothetical protein
MTTEERERRRADGKAKAEAALERLGEAVRRIVEDDEAFAEYLRLSGRMHSYSWGNRLLVWMQRPDASLVAGFHRWRELGRPVCKGSKGIQILAPMTRKVHAGEENAGWSTDEGDVDNEGNVYRVVGFRVAYVFAVQDTDGPAVAMPNPIPPDDDSDEAEGIVRLLTRRAHELGAVVTFESSDGLGNGGADGKPAGWCNIESGQIVVNADLPAAHRAKTLAHELAHHVAGRLERRDSETVAEGAAFVVASSLGLDTEGYSAPYIAGWAQELARVRSLLESIAVVAGDILAEIDLPETLQDRASAVAREAVAA